MINRHFGVVGVMLMAAFLSIGAGAQVRDDGEFFASDAVTRADDTIRQMRRDVGRALLIETYGSIPAERAATYDPANKDAFFVKWLTDRATAAHVDIFVLINRDPSYLLIRAGANTRKKDFTPADEKQLRDAMLPLMKAKDFDGALEKATSFIPQKIKANRGSPAGASNSGATRAPPPPPSGNYTAPAPPPQSNPNYPSYPSEPSPAPSSGRGMVGGFIFLIIIAVIAMVVLRAIFGGGRPTSSYGPSGYGGFGGGGGGFGRGFLGGILGGMAGGWLQDRMSGHHDSSTSFGAPPPVDSGSSFGDPSSSSSDSSFSSDGGAGGSFDSGSSSSGGDNFSGSGDGGAGGSF